jgi:hypothetical protein
MPQADVLGYGPPIGLVKEQLAKLAGKGLASSAAVSYPAIAVRRYASLHGLTADLETSEQVGVRALLADIRGSYLHGCDTRPVLLAGYSQGAEVVIRAVDELSAAQQAHVTIALFGNPSYLPDLDGDFPGKTVANGIRPSIKHVAFTLPAAVRARTIDICAPGDPVCGVDPDRETVVGKLSYVISHAQIHETAYSLPGERYTSIAARFLWRHRAP